MKKLVLLVAFTILGIVVILSCKKNSDRSDPQTNLTQQMDPSSQNMVQQIIS
ncbi:MAG: hypothetical protein KBC43_13405 [Bacteroidales bacterium]|nr:hypothetical protein [Bacteroidales bacterium]